MTSIRRRLTVLLTVGIGLLWLAALVATERSVASHATDGLDRALLEKARRFVALTEHEGTHVELDYRAEAMPEYERVERPEYFQFWRDDGTVLLRSRHLRGDLPRGPAAPGGSGVLDVGLPDGRPGRAAWLVFRPHAAAPDADGAAPDDRERVGDAPPDAWVVVAVARDRADLDRLLAAIRTSLGAIGVVATLVGAWWLRRALATGLRPVGDVARQVEGLDVDRPGARVVAAAAPAEISPLVGRLNELLDRLDAARARERRFTGNVAHELRTPIAELRALAAVGARWPGDESSVEQFFRDVETVAGHMDGLVADLLELSRAQAEAGDPPLASIPLAAAVESAAARVAARHGAAAGGLELDVPGDLRLRSEPRRLAIVLTNLFDNAVGHRHAGGAIRAVARRDGGRFRLEITNPAAPMSDEDLARLTEPFWRGDAARSPGEHAGLGLALVAALAPRLRLDVSFHRAADDRFTARVEGDAEPPSASGPPAAAPEARTEPATSPSAHASES